jgi:hypothetical protein
MPIVRDLAICLEITVTFFGKGKCSCREERHCLVIPLSGAKNPYFVLLSHLGAAFFSLHPREL